MSNKEIQEITNAAKKLIETMRNARYGMLDEIADTDSEARRIFLQSKVQALYESECAIREAAQPFAFEF